MRHLWVVVALLLAGCAMVPLPSDVRIIPPGPGIPTEVAAFSGKWQGVGDETLDHILVVEGKSVPDTYYRAVGHLAHAVNRYRTPI